MRFLRYILPLTAAMLAMTAAGAPLTPQQALARLESSKMKVPGEVSLSTTITRGDLPCCYVFNRSEGFLILSADDRVAPLLGYSDEGRFDSTQASPELRWWLDCYASQIEWLQRQGETAYAPAGPRPELEPISPLVKARWSQHQPFNNFCPLTNGVHAVAGCAATAIAQVMYTHKWPVQPTGTNSYEWNGETLSMDFSTVRFDWDNMLDYYEGVPTNDAQKESVAWLTLANGIAINMNYTATASGASIVNMYKGLLLNFGYDKGMFYADRDMYPLFDWERKIHEQLAAGNPVIYCGQSGEGGHAFVCDGYASDGFFHINWGWGGMSDGYFLLSALNPLQQGTGGSGEGFNYSQTCIMGIQPPQPDSRYIYQLYMPAFSPAPGEYAVGDAVAIDDYVFNTSVSYLECSFGARFEPADGGEPVYAYGPELWMHPFTSVEHSYFYIPKGLKENTVYKVTPIFRREGKQPQDADIYLCGQQYARAEVRGGKVVFSATENTLPQVSGVSIESPFYIGREFLVRVTVTNSLDREYYSTIFGALTDESGEMVAKGIEIPLDLDARETESIDYYSYFQPAGDSPLTPGTYLFSFMVSDAMGNCIPVSQPIAAELKAVATATAVEIADLSLPGQSLTTDSPENLTVTFNASCIEGYYDRNFVVGIYRSVDDEWKAIAALYSGYVLIPEGETRHVVVKGSVDAEPGDVLLMAVFGYPGEELQQLSGGVEFKVVTKGTGMAQTMSDAADAEEWFTLDGRAVSRPSLPGIYLCRCTPGGKTTTHKIIIR